MNKIKRILSMVLVLATLMSVLAVFPPIEVGAASATCVSETCTKGKNCDVTCTFNPKSTLTWGKKLSFSGEIIGDSNIKKVTVRVYDIDDNGKPGFETYTNSSIGSETFDLSEVYDLTAGENLSKDWDGVTICIFVVLSNETDIHHEFVYNIEFEDLDTPTISSPDEDDTFYAGDDITFKWGSVSGAEEFEWEFYETNRYYGKLLDSGTTKTSSSYRKAAIDGDLIKAGKTYTFYVRAINDYSDSIWKEFDFYAYAKPSELYADTGELIFTKEGGTDYIDLTSSHDWEATASHSWIKISDDSGFGDEEIAVTVGSNTGSSRVGTITFTSDVGSITVIVSQAKGETLRLDVETTKIQLSYEEGYRTFYVTSNLPNWQATSNVDWLSVTNSIMHKDDSVKISVDENNSTEPRTGTITVSGGGITKTVTVTQEGRPAIVGDINNDGKITNKDRFLLNRYLANMAGYTDIDKTLADINGDGSIKQADVEYLTRYLAGWAGYEKLPEINTDSSACAHTQYTNTYYNTVYVSDTIKTNTTHAYYHVYNRKCSCGMDIGKVQGDLITENHSYENNLCACGAYKNASYAKWTGVNVSGAQANVYSTPTATVRYGYINKNEAVTVIGEYGDKYLIEYTLDNGNGIKQGYVDKDILLVQIAKQYQKNRSNYANKHQICIYRTDGVLLSVIGMEEHIFDKSEITYRYADNGNSSHTVYKDQYEICKCGYSRLVSTENYKATVPHSPSNNDKYVCCLCAGNIHYFSNPNPTPKPAYAINYQGTEYPISFPDYDYASNSNYDITFGGWSTVYEKVYNDRKWDVANFIGNLELDDESYLLAGIALTEQLLTNLVHTDFIKIVLQKNQATGKNRALILIGDNSNINRGEVGSNKCLYVECTNNTKFTENNVPPYVNPYNAKEIADWLIRSSGISLPSEGWSIDDKLLYNVNIVYSNSWNSLDNYYKYLSFNEKGEAITIERMMSDDRYQLFAYENDTLLQIILYNSPISDLLVRPCLTENIKKYFIQPIQADSGEFIENFSDEFNIVKISN